MASWFRSFGYSAQSNINLEGATGNGYLAPLLLERDARRIAVYGWLRGQSLDPSVLDTAVGSVRDAGCDSALILCLAPLTEPQKLEAGKLGVTLWDAKRIVQELGEAVLSEMCPDVWTRSDPLAAARPSRVREAVRLEAFTKSEPAPPSAPPAEPALEIPFPAAVPPLLAAPDTQPAPELRLPAAFGALEAALAQTVSSPPDPTINGGPPLPRVLRLQVSKSLASSLVRKRIGLPDRIFLRLSPYYVFDYEAHILVDGSLDAEPRRGRMAVDAAQKKVQEWGVPLETGTLDSTGVDVDEKKVRLPMEEASALLKAELSKVVTRDVVMEEDADDWSVVVKKKVTLGPDDVRVTPQGLYYLPVWRVSGKQGAVEIDAASGQVVFEEILAPRTDAQLL